MSSKSKNDNLKTNVAISKSKTNREKFIQFLQLNQKLHIKCEKKSIIVNDLVLKSLNQLYRILFTDDKKPVSLNSRYQLQKLYKMLNYKQKSKLKKNIF